MRFKKVYLIVFQHLYLVVYGIISFMAMTYKSPLVLVVTIPLFLADRQLANRLTFKDVFYSIAVPLFVFELTWLYSIINLSAPMIVGDCPEALLAEVVVLTEFEQTPYPEFTFKSFYLLKALSNKLGIVIDLSSVGISFSVLKSQVKCLFGKRP